MKESEYVIEKLQYCLIDGGINLWNLQMELTSGHMVVYVMCDQVKLTSELINF
jgi:hypothetical protein